MTKRRRLMKNKTALFFLASYIVVMLLPLCIGLAYYYPTTRTMLVERAAERSANAMDQLSRLMDAQLANVLNMPSYIVGNQQIIEYDILNDPLSARTARDQLGQMIRTNTFIEHLFLYMRENGYLIGARSGSFYFREIRENPTLYEMSFGEVSIRELQEMLDTAQKPVVIPSNSVVIAGQRYAKMLLFIMPVPQSRRAYGAALVCVPASNLASIIPMDNSDLTGSVLFFSDTGALLYSSRELPVEERQTVDLILSGAEAGKGMRYAQIGGATHLVTWSTSAKYGWRYANVIPLQAVTREVNHFQSMTILITGCIVALSAILIYIAMKVNYLPIQKLARLAAQDENAPAKPLSDFESIRTLIQSLKTDNSLLGERISLAEPQLREYLIAQIIHGEAKDLPGVLRQAEQIGIDLSQKPYRVAIARYLSAGDAEDALARLIERESSEEGEIIASQGDTFEQLNLILSGQTDISRQELFRRTLGPYALLALGSVVNEPAEICDSYQQADAVLDYMLLNSIADKQLSYEELPDRMFKPRSYPIDVMQSLEMAIQHGDYERMQKLIDQIVSLLSIEGAPPYYTRSVYFNAVNLLITGLNRMVGDDNETVMEIGTRSMLNHYTASEMIDILRNTSEQLARMMRQTARKEASISEIMLSIERQISSPELSLQSVADEMGMAPSAFSRMFKAKSGKNFKEHVDGLRIARAKQLLSGTLLPVEQIACEVGYETPTSFYRLFKKHVGIAPGEYRQVYTNGKTV